MKKLLSATLDENEAKIVEVEVSFIRALPAFSIVGLPSTIIQESKDRVKSALHSIGFTYPASKITINLSPSDIKKEGSHFDLCMALLISLYKEKVNFDGFFVFAELGLGGKLKNSASVFSLLLSLASKVKNAKVLISKQLSKKVSFIPNLEVYAVDNLEEAVLFFKNLDFQEKCKITQIDEISKHILNLYDEKYIINHDFSLDFIDVKGQERAKNAALIAATGFHNILMQGSPGCGKSMIAKRLRYILPPLKLNEVLQIAAQNSLNGEEKPFEFIRPFRAPHHTSTRASIFGGGTSSAKIGEVALANLGILFFDEFPHFLKQIIESLREPLEDKKVLISRVNSKTLYQTSFLFVAAMNPCSCGNLFSTKTACICTDLDIKRYRSKISSPIIDRIDLYVEMQSNLSTKVGLSSAKMYEKMLKAFSFQKQRKQTCFNANLKDEELKDVCKLEKNAQDILDTAINRYDLSFRAINKVLKVSRSIADLQENEEINKNHLLEALGFRQKLS